MAKLHDSNIASGLWAVTLLVLYVSQTLAARDKTASVFGSKCEYTLVVNEFDASKCPAIIQPIQADVYPGGQSRPIPQMTDGSEKKNLENLSIKLRDIETRLFGEMVKNQELNSTLSKHEYLLGKSQDMLNAYKSNFSSIFRTMMYMETKLRHQRQISRSLNHKLSNVILDVVEVNNILKKKVSTRSEGTVRDKEVAVESVSRVKSCPGISEESQVYRDCAEIYQEGQRKNGVFYIKPSYAACPVPVWCDMETPPGGWLMFQRRQDGKLNFKRNWQEYKNGFGDVSGEHWLGNDNIFLLSNQDHYELRVDLWDFQGNRVHAIYHTFKIDGERDKYKLHIQSHSGSAKDSLYRHDNMMFSTYDQDNDGRQEAHCAREWEAGWWFNNCWFALLNGPYHNRSDTRWRGIAWNHWKREQLARSEMKIRPSKQNK